MKIKKIEIYGFGKWNNVSFDLDDKLQLFFGKNEAGKSTLRQFVISILFGFSDAKGKNKYSQYKPHHGAAYGGNLTVEYDNQFYQIERVDKPKKNTVNITNIANGEKVDNQLLDEMLGQVDLATYREFFGFNQEDLELIQNVNHRTLQEKIMRMGAVGGDEWFSLEDKLDSDASSLYKARGQKPIINQLLKKMDQQEQLLAKEREEIPRYDTLLKNKQENQEQLEQLRDNQKNLQKKLSEFEDTQRSWKRIERLNSLNVQLSKIPSDRQVFNTEQETINWQEYQTTKQQVTRLQSTIEDLKTKVSTRTEDKELEEISEQIPAIKLQMGQQEDYKRRIQRIDTSLEESRFYGPSKVNISDVKLLDENNTNDLQKLLLTKSRKESEINQIKNQILSMPQKNEKFNFLNPFIIGAVVGSILDWLLPIPSSLKFVLLIIVWGFVLLIGLRKRSNNKQDPLQLQLQDEEALLDEAKQGLSSIGKKSNMEHFDDVEWPIIQNLTLQLRKSEKDLEAAKIELDRLNDDVSNFWNQVHSIKRFADLSEDEKGIQKLQQEQLEIKQAEHNNATVNGQIDAQSDQLNLQTNRNLLAIDKLKQFFSDEQIKTDKVPMLIDEERQSQAVKKEFDELNNTITTDQIKRYHQFDDINSLEDHIRQHKQLIDQNQRDQNLLLDKRADKTGRIDGLISRNEIQELEQSLEETKAELADQIHSWLVDRMAKKWIDETLEKATHGRLPEIISTANEFFYTLTDGRYNEITIDSQNITVKRSEDHENFVLGELSRGTTDQLYISLRFAFVEIVSNSSSLPLIIDDGFVSFDSERTLNVFKIIKKLSQSHQVIYLTSNEEMVNLNESNDVLNLA